MEKSKGSSVVVGGERSEHGLVAVVVVPDRGGEGEESLEDAHGDALGAVAAVVFEAELGFEGVVDRFDDLTEASQLGCAAAAGLVGAGRADEFDAVVGESALELGRGVALVGDDRLTARRASRPGSASNMSIATSRSSTFGLAKANVIGSPAGVHTRCRRSPQKYRECDAQ